MSVFLSIQSIEVSGDQCCFEIKSSRFLNNMKVILIFGWTIGSTNETLIWSRWISDPTVVFNYLGFLCLPPYRAFYFDHINRKCHLLPFNRFSEGAKRERKPNYDLYEKKGKYLQYFTKFAHTWHFTFISSKVSWKCFVGIPSKCQSCLFRSLVLKCEIAASYV